MTETIEKIARIRRYLKVRKLDGVILGTRANFAWLSSGGDNHVVSQGEGGVGALVVTGKLAWVVANRIEIDRLHTEEALASFTPKTFPWVQPLSEALKKLLPGKRYVSDDPAVTGFRPLPPDFIYTLRAPLVETEIRRYKALGRDAAMVMETVARQVSKGDSEHQVEADLARHLLARGIQPHVILVAFDQRVEKYRHPTPTANHLRNAGMLVICGQRHGLIVSLTRLVHFGPIAPDLLRRHEAVCRIEAALWEATVPGVTYGAVLRAGIARYKAVGFSREWELHHQGGPTGYAGRDFLVTPEEKRKVLDHQAVAWNPSITGTKTEDTFITDGKNRVVITGCSPEWPTLTVKTPAGVALERPAILVR
jgi:Xaa-Pro aminopeptidase